MEDKIIECAQIARNEMRREVFSVWRCVELPELVVRFAGWDFERLDPVTRRWCVVGNASYFWDPHISFEKL